MRFERHNCLTDAGQRGLHFLRFRDKIGRGAAEQAMIQDTAVLGSEAEHGQGAIARHERRDANESGAANVTILLDGKFSTRTDSQGKFEFPLVAAGTHAISVIADNLPLPYFVGGTEKRQVIVRTRETTSLDIAS